MQDLNNESVVNIDRARFSSPFITFCRMQKRIAKLHSLASASRFICFFRFRSDPKWPIEKVRKREKKGKTYGTVYNDVWNPPRRTAVDQNPLHRTFSRKGKWRTRVVTTWRESHGFSLHGRVIDASRSIGMFPIMRWYRSERFEFPCRLREHLARDWYYIFWKYTLHTNTKTRDLSWYYRYRFIKSNLFFFSKSASMSVKFYKNDKCTFLSKI